jgi:hypothetical protein
MEAFPSRQPCQATQRRPFESVAATASISVPGEFVIRTVAPGLPFSIDRAKISKLPLSLDDQNTHGRPCPSTAIAGRHRSPPGCEIAIGSLQAPLPHFLTSTWSPPGFKANKSKRFGVTRILLWSG